MALALFDLDRTLVSVNSALLWVRREREKGRISPHRALAATWWMGLYRLGFVAVERGVRNGTSWLAGIREPDLEAAMEAFWAEEIGPRVRPGGRAAVARHRAAGDRTVLLTSSIVHLGRIAAGDLGLDDAICTVPAVKEGVLTGDVVGTFCYGDGKLEHARRFAEACGELLETAWFYTDSAADLPVMEAVGHPVCVDPDRRLAREARRNGWPVEDWDAPSAEA
ncbi:MAG: HAD-IB family hydrolase [Deltaproteobacteria bacterium]|nr:HAD-IB family hydrolase [Deltaproteobacteria bacterium]